MTYKEKHKQIIEAKERAKRLSGLFPCSLNANEKKCPKMPRRQK